MREIADCKNHNPITSIYEVTSLLNFCKKRLVQSISLKEYRRELNETWYIDRQPSEKVQNARTLTLLQVITELFLFLIFATVSLSGAYL